MTRPMTTTSPIILIVDDDADIADGVAAALLQGDRTVIVAYDPVAAELALRRYGVTHVLTDVHFTGQFDFAGVAFLEAVRNERPSARVAVMSGYGGQAIRASAGARGAAVFVEKPASTLQIEAALDLPSAAAEDTGDLIRLPPIDELVEGSLLMPVFQPIVDVASGRFFGYEALIRADAPAPLATPDGLFEYAARTGRIVALNAACVEASLREVRHLSRHARIFLNVDPPALGQIDFPRLLGEYGIDPSRVVVELSEAFAVLDEPRAIAAIEELHAAGIALAFDDVGDAYSHFPLLARAQPQFLKVSRRIGALLSTTGGDRLIAGLLAFANELGTTLILEGLETREDFAKARQLGIELAQGYWFGRPVAAHLQTVRATMTA